MTSEIAWIEIAVHLILFHLFFFLESFSILVSYQLLICRIIGKLHLYAFFYNIFVKSDLIFITQNVINILLECYSNPMIEVFDSLAHLFIQWLRGQNFSLFCPPTFLEYLVEYAQKFSFTIHDWQKWIIHSNFCCKKGISF